MSTHTITAETESIAYRETQHSPLKRGKIIHVDTLPTAMVLVAPMPVTAAEIVSYAGQVMTDRAVWVDKVFIYA
jgi:hypothetical protein